MSDHVFISYARDDGSNFAKKIHDELEASGQAAWLDMYRIAGGATWTSELKTRIDECRVIPFVMTPIAQLAA